MQIIEIEERLFGAVVLFAVNCSAEELETHLNKEYKLKCDLEWLINHKKAAGTYLWFDEYPYRVVWVKKFNKNNPEHLSYLVHEICHLVVRICEEIGVVISSTLTDGSNRVNDEPVAYMMGYYFREFLEKYARSQKKKKTTKKTRTKNRFKQRAS